MRLSKVSLFAAGAALVLGAPVAANAAVFLDAVFLNAATQVHADGTSDHGSVTYLSPWMNTVASSFDKSASASTASAGASADGASSVSATLSSPSQGAYGFNQSLSLASSTSSDASGWANGEFFYYFDLSGPGLYDVVLNGLVSSLSDGALATKLYDVTTGTTLFNQTNTAGQTLSTTVYNLAAGRYLLGTENTVATNGDLHVNGTANPVTQAQYSFKIVSGIPEPGAWAMLLVGLFGLGGVLRVAKAREAGVIAG